MNLRRTVALFTAACCLSWPGAALAKLSNDDVIKMHKAGLPESVIVSTIKASGDTFELSATDIINLHKAGVPAKVIEAMMASKKAGPAAEPPKAEPPKAEPPKAEPPKLVPPRSRRDDDDDDRRAAPPPRRRDDDDDDRRARPAPSRRDDDADRRRSRDDEDRKKREREREDEDKRTREAADRKRREEDDRRKREDAERMAEDRRKREENERAAEDRRKREEAERLAEERKAREEREREDSERKRRADSQRLSEKMAVFTTGKDLEAAKKYSEAAGFYYEYYSRLASPGTQEYYDAEYFLGRSLHEGGLPQAAIPYFANIVRRGPKDPNFRRAFRRLRVIQEQLLVTLPEIMERLAEANVQEYPEDFRDEFNYTIGKFYNRVGNYTKAQRFLERVSERSDFFASSAYVQGLIALRARKAKSGHELFKKAVLSAEASPGRKGVDRGVLELGYLALARLAYEVGGHDAAIFYYNKIPQSSTKVGQALFEKGWVYFQAGNFPLALGTFHGLHSPYFADRFHPDLYILEATIYLSMCHHTMAKEMVEMYQKKYGGLHKNLKALLAQGTPPQELFKMFLATGEGSAAGGQLPRQLYSYVLQDAEFSDLVAALKSYDSQSKILGDLIRSRAKGDKLWTDASTEVEVRRERMNRQAGSMIRQKLQKAESELGELLIKADEITFESINAEKDQLDREAAALMTGAAIKEGKAKQGDGKVKFDWGFMYWEDQGEVWVDEVDSYRSLLGDGCKQ